MRGREGVQPVGPAAEGGVEVEQLFRDGTGALGVGLAAGFNVALFQLLRVAGQGLEHENAPGMFDSRYTILKIRLEGELGSFWVLPNYLLSTVI